MRPLTFEEWYFQIDALFVEQLGRDASTSNWDWERIFWNECMSPEEAFEDYLATL